MQAQAGLNATRQSTVALKPGQRTEKEQRPLLGQNFVGFMTELQAGFAFATAELPIDQLHKYHRQVSVAMEHMWRCVATCQSSDTRMPSFHIPAKQSSARARDCREGGYNKKPAKTTTLSQSTANPGMRRVKKARDVPHAAALVAPFVQRQMAKRSGQSSIWNGATSARQAWNNLTSSDGSTLQDPKQQRTAVQPGADTQPHAVPLEPTAPPQPTVVALQCLAAALLCRNRATVPGMHAWPRCC